MIYKFENIETKKQSIDDMKESVLNNIDTLNKLSSEIKNLKLGDDTNKTNEIQIKQTIDEQHINNEGVEHNEEHENTLLEEINYYYLRIRDFSLLENNENFNQLKKELPSKKKSNFNDIIMGIITFLMRDINEIKTFLESEKSIISAEELSEFKKDILDIEKKINIITTIGYKLNEQYENNIELEETYNNIVFLETETGKTYALEDLDNNGVPSEYYSGFYDLIHSIEDGTFKNAKFLTSGNYKTAGISEVKGFKKRIIFDRVGYDTYVIIGAFIKKSDKDKSYLDPLKNRIAIYRRNRTAIVEKIKNDPKYLESQNEILKQLYCLLENTKKRGL